MIDSGSRLLRVFLCHSSDDKPAVRELYQKLSGEGWIDVWLDEENLLPGQDWDYEIEKALDNSDAVIVSLSTGSILKEGYLQRELRFVLEIALEKPEGTIFLLPVRLEECERPRRLRSIQGIDYFPLERREWAYARLRRSLEIRAQGLGIVTVKPETNSKKTLPKKLQTNTTPDFEEPPKKNLLDLGEKRPVSQDIGTTQTEKYEAQEVPAEEDKPQFHSKTEEKTNLAPLESVYQPVTETIQNKHTEAPASTGGIDDSSKLAKDRVIWFGIEFCNIPEGPFLMGSDQSDPERLLKNLVNYMAFTVFTNESPRHVVYISYDYWISRFPVTNEQYSSYVQAVGRKHPVKNWEIKRSHPVVNVSWVDARNYLEWLNQTQVDSLPKGLIFRLPTEAEWEKAARGTNGFHWPWGNDFDITKCNSSEDNKGGTTPVGSYSPQGDSPYGCADMAGNVFEWTHSQRKDYPYVSTDGREYSGQFRARSLRLTRGGSFQGDRWKTRCAYRLSVDAGASKQDLGFRLVVAPLI